jgi:hypothetical protein
MNPQPDPIVGNFVALIIIVLVAFYTYKAYLTGKSIDLNKLDNFVIGYIEDYKYVENFKTVKIKPVRNHTIRNVSTERVTKPVEKKAKKSKVSATQTSTTTTPPPSLPEKPKRDEQLYNDCISSLVSLGYKKTEAKSKTKQAFDNHNINSIQEFIRFVTINTIDFA